MRRNNNKTDSIETLPIIIAYMLPLSGLENCMHTTYF